MFKKGLLFLSLLAISFPTFAAYEDIACSTDAVFSENSCDQCFNGGTVSEGEPLGFLTDLWVNLTDVKKLLYKEEQSDPQMINLNPANVSWSQTPSTDGFWEYPDEFNALYSDTEEGYVLDAGASITWIKSALSYAFKLDKSTVSEGENIGLLVYPIVSRSILNNGEITIDPKEHRECVLFKSGKGGGVPIVPSEPKELPKTGPMQYVLLLILALIIGFGILKFKTRS